MSGFTPINRHPSGWTPVNWTPETPAISAYSGQAQAEQSDPRLQGLSQLPSINSFDSTVNQQRPRTALPTSRPILSVDTHAQASSGQIEEPLKTPRGKHLSDAGKQKIFDLHSQGYGSSAIRQVFKESGYDIAASSVTKVTDKMQSGLHKSDKKRLSEETKNYIRELAQQGYGANVISQQTGVDRESIRRLLKS